MNNNLYVGNLGEDIAYKYLIGKKFKILKRNHREKSDEIDIISKSFDGILVFVEVKTLRRGNFISSLIPENNFTKYKFLKIKRGCLMFIAKHPKLIDEIKGWRMDLLAIILEIDGSFKINHYENVSL